MGLVRCLECKQFIDENEAVLIPVDDSHDAVYCLNCSDGRDNEMVDFAPEDEDLLK